MVEQYIERVHTEDAVLDIGQNIGALVVYTKKELLGKEIEVSIKGDDTKRIHTAIHERKAHNGHSIFAGIFLALPAGDYIMWVHPSCEVTIRGGNVAEIDWSNLDIYVPSTNHRHSYDFSQRSCDILPPRYQNGRAVSAAPMGTAPMRYTDDGQVAWNEMWTGYCELALAGGPPHRGDLLEPVSPDEVRANMASYEHVVREIERGFRLVTGLSTVRSEKLGWAGLRCESEEMALWLLRAIVVENVCVRREENVLFLPAGPMFTMEKEIKNVITVVAKTYHYWTEHISV